jgi:hypothetical protein
LKGNRIGISGIATLKKIQPPHQKRQEEKIICLPFDLLKIQKQFKEKRTQSYKNS